MNGNYTQTNHCGTVAVGGMCTTGVTFGPTATGTQGATLPIYSNAVGSPTLVTITGSAQ